MKMPNLNTEMIDGPEARAAQQKDSPSVGNGPLQPADHGFPKHH